MNPIVRSIRTGLQALTSLALSVPLAWFHVLPTGWLAVLAAGLVATVSVLHNLTNVLNFLDRFIPAKYKGAEADVAGLLTDLLAAAQAAQTDVSSVAPAAAVPKRPMSAGYVKPPPVPSVDGKDVAKKV